MLHELQQISVYALLTLVVGMIPLGFGLAYALRPAERWLTMMRPASLAAIFAALSSLMSGFIVILRGVAATPNGSFFSSRIPLGMAEACAPMFIIFACLTLAWLLVAVGEYRALRSTTTLP